MKTEIEKSASASYIIGNATVRIHGTPDMEKFKASTERFMKRAIERKRKGERANG